MLNQLSGVYHLIASLLYGSGLRVNECLHYESKISSSSAMKSWCGLAKVIRTGHMLPERIIPELQAHLQIIRPNTNGISCRPRARALASCPCQQVSQRVADMDVAIRVSCVRPLSRPSCG